MRAIAVLGPKKSGKSALTALIAEALEKKGQRVAIVKHSSRALDKGNADAFWFMRPGRAVINVSPEETALFWPRRLEFAEITAQLEADVVLIEGGDVLAGMPLILCLKDGTKKEIAALSNKKLGQVLATHGKKPAKEDVPHFAEADPETADQLADLILSKN